jgi:hypothetical protein
MAYLVQMIRPESLSNEGQIQSSIHYDTDLDFELEIWDMVILAPNFAEFRDAASGPLSPNKVEKAIA